jgi:hypothetical protein
MVNSSDWRQTLHGVLDPQAPAPENPLVRAIEEFVAELNKSPWVQAALRPGPVSQVKTLVTGPKTTRDQDTPMLSFWVQNGFVRVVGEGSRELRSRDEVLRYLTDFAVNSAFPETVAEYKDICQDNMLGFLSVGKEGGYEVVVLPDSQRRLADQWRAPSDKSIAFWVDFQSVNDDFPAVWKKAGAGKPLKGDFRQLESGGFEMRVMGVDALGGGTFRARGDVLR